MAAIRYILGTQCITLSLITIVYTIALMCSKYKQLRKQDAFMNLCWLILVYSVLKLLYAFSLFFKDVQVWVHVEQVVVGIN